MVHPFEKNSGLIRKKQVSLRIDDAESEIINEIIRGDRFNCNTPVDVLRLAMKDFLQHDRLEKFKDEDISRKTMKDLSVMLVQMICEDGTWIDPLDPRLSNEKLSDIVAYMSNKGLSSYRIYVERAITQLPLVTIQLAAAQKAQLDAETTRSNLSTQVEQLQEKINFKTEAFEKELSNKTLVNLINDEKQCSDFLYSIAPRLRGAEIDIDDNGNRISISEYVTNCIRTHREIKSKLEDERLEHKRTVFRLGRKLEKYEKPSYLFKKWIAAIWARVAGIA